MRLFFQKLLGNISDLPDGRTSFSYLSESENMYEQLFSFVNNCLKNHQYLDIGLGLQNSDPVLCSVCITRIWCECILCVNKIDPTRLDSALPMYNGLIDTINYWARCKCLKTLLSNYYAKVKR